MSRTHRAAAVSITATWLLLAGCGHETHSSPPTKAKAVAAVTTPAPKPT
jgi:hypothetical protein